MCGRKPATQVARYDNCLHLAVTACKLRNALFSLDRVDVVIGDDYVLTCHRGEPGFLKVTKRQYRGDFLRFARSPSFLLYELWDHLLDEYLEVQKEFEERVDRFASALRGAGLRKGDRVAFLCPNTPAMLEAQFAVPAAGGIVVAGAAVRALDLPVPSGPLLGAAALLAASNVVFALLNRRPRAPLPFAWAQVVTDLVILTFALYVSGGVGNPFGFFFVFHVIIASILLPVRMAYLTAGIATAWPSRWPSAATPA